MTRVQGGGLPREARASWYPGARHLFCADWFATIANGERLWQRLIRRTDGNHPTAR